ncbi:MAG TPA: hypothetical protein VK280_13910 [Streptosporangiaceae bacterium]|nr:hypothetical protein [Streptosporangiaceae bacterium]
MQAALARSEQAHNAPIAQAWRQLTALFGYRLRPGSGITFEAMATLLSAAMRGLVVMALSSPEVAGQRIEASPFGASARAEWSLPALGLGGIASAFLEPDPAVEWDAERIAAVRQALAALTPLIPLTPLALPDA